MDSTPPSPLPPHPAAVFLQSLSGLSSRRGKPFETHSAEDDGEQAGTEMPKSRLRRADVKGADACLRWSHQSALVKDTIYIYGGQARATRDQKTNTWSMSRPPLSSLVSFAFVLRWLNVWGLDNNLLTLSLSNDWDAGSPPLMALPQPNGPPAVANGWVIIGSGIGNQNGMAC